MHIKGFQRLSSFIGSVTCEIGCCRYCSKCFTNDSSMDAWALSALPDGGRFLREAAMASAYRHMDSRISKAGWVSTFNQRTGPLKYHSNALRYISAERDRVSGTLYAMAESRIRLAWMRLPSNFFCVTKPAL